MEEQGKTEWLLCPRCLDAVQTTGSVCAAIIFRAWPVELRGSVVTLLEILKRRL